MTEYLIPTGPGEAEFVEKRSSFLGHVRLVETEDEARAFIAEMKKKYYDARHNCWCYIIKDGAERYSDDGEPQGTAGIPMLEVFRREGVSNVVCVVTRYFGGILLGTGGLVRAYSHVAKLAAEAAHVITYERFITCEIICDYTDYDKIRASYQGIGLMTDGVDFAADVTQRLAVRAPEYEAFCASLVELTNGAVLIETTGERFDFLPDPANKE